MNPVLAAILARRSSNPRHLNGPGVTQDDLTLIGQAVAAAPDHGRLGPLRLIHIPDDRRMDLAEVFANAAHEADPDASEDVLQAAIDRALAGASLLVIIATIDAENAQIPAQEQWICVGAGLQNVLLTAESLGFQSKIVSGKRVSSLALRVAFALKQNEHLVGFVVLGRFSGTLKNALRREPGDVLVEWNKPNSH